MSSVIRDWMRDLCTEWCRIKHFVLKKMSIDDTKKKIHLILKLRFFFKLLCEEINVKILVFSRKYQFIKFVKTHGNEKILPFCNFDERFFFKLSQCAGVGKVKKNRTHKERRGWRRLAEALPGSDRGPGCLLHKW